ncbi:hypothetical protein BB561_004423 [Smittium simulii]|uniref:Uncharacterized protein n=1 Tax=Smittium simulii TaxID=133385 RepID=A0A2T9YGE7_9FUNG|nr:hypothetical protein BB561_004423 [Smittium simulii]
MLVEKSIGSCYGGLNIELSEKRANVLINHNIIGSRADNKHTLGGRPQKLGYSIQYTKNPSIEQGATMTNIEAINIRNNISRISYWIKTHQMQNSRTYQLASVIFIAKIRLTDH